MNIDRYYIDERALSTWAKRCAVEADDLPTAADPMVRRLLYSFESVDISIGLMDASSPVGERFFHADKLLRPISALRWAYYDALAASPEVSEYREIAERLTAFSTTVLCCASVMAPSLYDMPVVHVSPQRAELAKRIQELSNSFMKALQFSTQLAQDDRRTDVGSKILWASVEKCMHVIAEASAKKLLTSSQMPGRTASR